jgi:hypothetical protein
MEMNIRSIPGSNTKYIGTAAPHHGEAFGSLFTIDVSIEDDNMMSQMKRITPTIPLPESESFKRVHDDGIDRYEDDWGTPWPLSEDFYLASYHDGGVYLLDRFGNKELICALNELPLSQTCFTRGTSQRCLRIQDPVPFCARTRPPVQPTKTWEGERAGLPDHNKAVISVMNVYSSDSPWTDSSWAGQRKIKYLRVVQLLTRSRPVFSDLKIGYGNQTIARMPLGIVPVEDDGSVYFEAPVGKAIYFQALDSNYMAVQSMRSITYVHPGEHLTCVGCHESKWETPPPVNPKALQRAPSKLVPEVGGVEPVNFHRLVKPTFNTTCVSCHMQKSKGPANMGYPAMEPYSFYFHGGGNGHIAKSIHGGSRTIPGWFGAYYSKTGKALLDSNHVGKVTEEEFRRTALWLDLNSLEFGAYYDTVAQRNGELRWPRLDVDSTNPQGIETDIGVASIYEKGPARIVYSSDLQISLKGSLINIINPERVKIHISIYDVSGRRLLDSYMEQGLYRKSLNLGHNYAASGLYFVRLTSMRGEQLLTKSVVFLK